MWVGNDMGSYGSESHQLGTSKRTSGTTDGQHVAFAIARQMHTPSICDSPMSLNDHHLVVTLVVNALYFAGLYKFVWRNSL